MLTIHLACTWMLVGLIWVIQVVVYPQLRRIGDGEFVAYHFSHCWRIGLLIVPLVTIEAATAAALLYQGHREGQFLASVVLLPVIWLSTIFVQAPMHARLMRGANSGIVRRLIATNWVRTLAWTARGVLVGSLMAG